MYTMGKKSLISPSQKARLVFRMFHIFLCDDDVEYLANLKSQVTGFIQNSGIMAKIYTFTSMEAISDQLIKSCDIAILDIDFAGKKHNGIDIAKRLRGFRKDAMIIFATNYIEYAPEGYEVQAFRYIMKRDIPQKLFDYLDQAIKRLHTDIEVIQFQINGERIDIPISQILYIESQLHTVRVFVQGQGKSKPVEYSFYSSISKLEQQLSEKGFLRIHKSFLVNAAHVQRYQCHALKLDCGIELNASASRYAEQKAKYLLWKGHVMND